VQETPCNSQRALSDFVRSTLDLLQMKAANYNYNRDRTAMFSVVILILTGLAGLMILCLKLLYMT